MNTATLYNRLMLNKIDMSEISIGQEGTIFIVDISGYTRFVKETENSIGVLIVSHLLKEIIAANRLSFSVSEIEGDAILFYRYGKPYPVEVMVKQFDVMLKAFNRKIAEFKVCTTNVAHLSIKSVAHYGEIGQFSIGNFKKLYGKTLIEAHRLLKNTIHRNTYTLITRQYFDACPASQVEVSVGIQQSEKYDVGELSYTYFAYPNIIRKPQRPEMLIQWT